MPDIDRVRLERQQSEYAPSYRQYGGADYRPASAQTSRYSAPADVPLRDSWREDETRRYEGSWRAEAPSAYDSGSSAWSERRPAPSREVPDLQASDLHAPLPSEGHSAPYSYGAADEYRSQERYRETGYRDDEYGAGRYRDSAQADVDLAAWRHDGYHAQPSYDDSLSYGSRYDAPHVEPSGYGTPHYGDSTYRTSRWDDEPRSGAYEPRYGVHDESPSREPADYSYARHEPAEAASDSVTGHGLSDYYAADYHMPSDAHADFHAAPSHRDERADYAPSDRYRNDVTQYTSAGRYDDESSYDSRNAYRYGSAYGSGEADRMESPYSAGAAPSSSGPYLSESPSTGVSYTGALPVSRGYEDFGRYRTPESSYDTHADERVRDYSASDNYSPDYASSYHYHPESYASSASSTYEAPHGADQYGVDQYGTGQYGAQSRYRDEPYAATYEEPSGYGAVPQSHDYGQSDAATVSDAAPVLDPVPEAAPHTRNSVGRLLGVHDAYAASPNPQPGDSQDVGKPSATSAVNGSAAARQQAPSSIPSADPQHGESAAAASSSAPSSAAAEVRNAVGAAGSVPPSGSSQGAVPTRAINTTVAAGEGASLAKSSRPEAEIVKESGDVSTKTADKDRFTIKDFMIFIALPVVLVLCVRIFLVGVYRVPSGSMMDTIEIGDHLITNKLAPKLVKPKRGDVVVFKDPANWLSAERASGTDTLVKRLIGLPGDTVACKGKGSPITINGKAIDESVYLKTGVSPSDFPFEVKVKAGNIFVLGDNRSNSADSRYHTNDGNNGLVPIRNIKGVGLFTIWPLNRIGSLSSHHEVFKSVPDADSRTGR